MFRLLSALLLMFLKLSFTFAQMTILGNASQTNDSCWSITSATPWQGGGIFSENSVDFTKNLRVHARVFFGCNNADGADGIAFVISSQPILGQNAGGLGYANLLNSVAIEFDNFQNPENGDPSYDHVAIVRGGNPKHQDETNVAGPAFALSGGNNLEDCEWHDLYLSWTANQLLLEVYIDCSRRLFLEGDNLLQTAFAGNNTVFWGFTGGTGDLFNQQLVCITEPTAVDAIQDSIICQNDSLYVTLPPGYDYHWQPESIFNDPFSRTPTIFTTESQVAQVTWRDACGRAYYDEFAVGVDPCQEVKIPNTFTPNDDNINDRFGFIPQPGIIELEKFLIYDRWGELVFQAYYISPLDYEASWDGTQNGLPMPDDVFVWIAHVRLKSGELRLMSGDVTLLR